MRFNESEEIMDYVNLFVSVLICFPEVGTIKYDRNERTLFFTFILREMSYSEEVETSLSEIDAALTTYHQIEKIIPRHYDVQHYAYDGYLVLEVQRDIPTITRAEITFLIELFRMKFLDHLIMEDIDQNMLDEYGWYHEDDVDLFADRKSSADMEVVENKILVLRESGKVLVFSN